MCSVYMFIYVYMYMYMYVDVLIVLWWENIWSTDNHAQKSHHYQRRVLLAMHMYFRIDFIVRTTIWNEHEYQTRLSQCPNKFFQSSVYLWALYAHTVVLQSNESQGISKWAQEVCVEFVCTVHGYVQLHVHTYTHSMHQRSKHPLSLFSGMDPCVQLVQKLYMYMYA